MKIFILFLMVFFTSCEAQSKLPKQMPADLRISFSENGGMSPYFKNILIEGETIKYKARMPQEGQKIIEWMAKISNDDKAKLYQLFIENKFDTIKNEKRNGIVYDAGSEGVSISFGKDSFQVSYGANSPLSKTNQKLYRAVANEIENLAKKYESMVEKPIEITLEEARKQAVTFFDKIYQPVPEKTMYQLRFSPFFPTEWENEKPIDWISYAYAQGQEISLNDGERVGKFFGKIIYDPTTQKSYFEMINDRIEGGNIQGVKPVSNEVIVILGQGKEIEKIILGIKSKAELSENDTKKVSKYYELWKQFNGVIYADISRNHGSFNKWIFDEAAKKQ